MAADHRSRPRTTGWRAMAAIDWQPRTRGGVIAKAAAEVAERVGAKYLVAFTQSGDSARRLSRYRGPIPVLAFTPEAKVRSPAALTWGVETFKTDPVEHTDEMVRQVDEQLLKIGRVKEGDLVVIIAGSPPGIPGSTNALRIHRMGDAINEVAPAYRRDPTDAVSALGPIRRRGGARRRAARPRCVDQLDWRHAMSTRSSAPQHRPRMSCGVVGELPARVVVALRRPATVRVAQFVDPAAVGVEQPAQEGGRMRRRRSRRCQASSTIGRSCLRPGPCCGNRQGQCFQRDCVTTTPGHATRVWASRRA